MVIKWILDAMVAGFTQMVNLLPAPTVPTWLTGLDAAVAKINGFINELQAWVPSQAAVAILATFITVFGISVVASVIRMIVSLFTGGGGRGA